MLTDAELYAYLENAVSSAVAGQIENSAELRQRAAALAAESRKLTALLYRYHCPTADQLGDYRLGWLPAHDSRATAQHVAICPHCSRELVQMARFLGEPAPATPSLAERIKIWFANALSAPEPDAQRALAFRGEEDGLVLFESNGVQISIDVQDDVEHAGYRAIIGLVIGGEEQSRTAQLYQNGEHCDSQAVDEAGSFLFNRLAPGEYELILNGGDVLVHLPSLLL